MNFVDRLLPADVDPARPAILTLEAEHSYGELIAAVAAVSRFCAARGAQPGDPVGIHADNSLFWVAAYLGAMRAGCVAVWADAGPAATVGARDGACAAEFGGAPGDGEALAGARTAAVEPVAALGRADVLAGAGAVEPVAALGRADVLVGAAAVEPVAALGRAEVLVGVCACIPELACAFAGALAGALACARR